MNTIPYLLGILVPWIAKTGLYHYGFRWRNIHATIQTKILIAGAPLLVRAFWPFAMSGFVFFVVSVGVGVYLCRQYTDGKLFPDIVGIVTGIEIINSLIIDRIIGLVIAVREAPQITF